MEKIINKNNPWWSGRKERSDEYVRIRLFKELLSAISGEGVLLHGGRGVGKTKLMKQLIRYLLESKHVDPRAILFLDSEDYGLKSLDMTEVLSWYKVRYSIGVYDQVYVFIDEVSNYSDFGKLISLAKKMFKPIFIFSTSVTINQIKGLSSLHVPAMDFFEHSEMQGRVIGKDNFHIIDKYFKQYLDGAKNAGSCDLLDMTVNKDIVVRRAIKNSSKLKVLFILIARSIGQPFSINMAARELGLSPDTVKRFLDYMENAYLIKKLEKEGKGRGNRMFLIYFGSIYIAKTLLEDLGKIYENYVFLALGERLNGYSKLAGGRIGMAMDNKVVVISNYGGEGPSPSLDSGVTELRNLADLQKLI